MAKNRLGSMMGRGFICDPEFGEYARAQGYGESREKPPDELEWSAAIRAIAEGQGMVVRLELPEGSIRDIEDLKIDNAALRSDLDDLRKEVVRRHAFPRPTAEMSKRFDLLASQWEAETGHLSSIVKKSLHPAYQQIIGMGSPAIELILSKLKETYGDWFWALSAITGENPITVDIAGDVKQMTEAWLIWGRTRGLVA